jgi:hypothetical protein
MLNAKRLTATAAVTLVGVDELEALVEAFPYKI